MKLVETEFHQCVWRIRMKHANMKAASDNEEISQTLIHNRVVILHAPEREVYNGARRTTRVSIVILCAWMHLYKEV